MAALAALIIGIYRSPVAGASPAPWRSAWGAVGAGVAVFLVLRWVQNALWGLAGGLLLALHPVFREAVVATDPNLLAETLALLALAGTVAGCRLVFLPRFAWRSWLVGAVVLTVATGLAWPVQPAAGLAAASLVSIGLIGAVGLATRLHFRPASVLPSWLNMATAALVAISAPLTGLFLAPASVHHLGWRQAPVLAAESEAVDYWHAAVDANWTDYRVQGFSASELRQWGWPNAWVVLTLTSWGFWRCFRRGWKNWAKRKAPTAWVLTIFTLITLAIWAIRPQSGGNLSILPLAGLAVLLSVFGIADVVRGFMERLVLAPPHERDQ
jgi:hypothetical protein